MNDSNKSFIQLFIVGLKKYDTKSHQISHALYESH